jgi:hypothetical protein
MDVLMKKQKGKKSHDTVPLIYNFAVGFFIIEIP